MNLPLPSYHISVADLLGETKIEDLSPLERFQMARRVRQLNIARWYSMYPQLAENYHIRRQYLDEQEQKEQENMNRMEERKLDLLGGLGKK